MHDALGWTSVIELVLALVLLWRNHKVGQFRIFVLNLVSVAARSDIELGYSWYWRYEIMDAVCYAEMVFKLWRPLKLGVWYPDNSFIIPNQKQPTINV